MANQQPRWPKGAKPPPPGARGGRFMPKELWAERISEQIGRKRGTPEIELVSSSITRPGSFRVLHGGVDIGEIYVDPRGDGSAYAFPVDDGSPGLAPAPTWKRTKEEAIQVLIDTAASNRDPETQLWLDEEKIYGPPVARMRQAMREQRLSREQIATGVFDLRAGRYVYSGERFDRLVRPRGQAGKSWFVQDANPQYLGSLPLAQIESRLALYRQLVETMRRVEGGR